MNYKYAICHYGEIGLKGKNRNYFEDKLVENIKKALSGKYKKVKKLYGRILIELPDISPSLGKEGLGMVGYDEIEKKLKTVFGIVNFSFAVSCEQDIEVIKEKVFDLLKDEKFESFRITARRSNKNFPLNSQQVGEQVGAKIFLDLKKKVDLKNPDVNCFIDITSNDVFIYFKKIKGLGGLPVGVSSKAVVMLSGGIDSPVAAYCTMKRGTRVVFAHFHSYPYTSKESVVKVKELATILNKFQFNSKIYQIPFADLQKEIFMKVPDKLRVIFYRRFMVRIAEEIAKKEGAEALVTGDAVGQVASQTLPNINVINKVATLSILRPLITFDKEEIMDKAREIGTYDTSIKPHDDCCSRLLPKHPETRAKLDEVEGVEKEFDIKSLVQEVLKEVKIEKI